MKIAVFAYQDIGYECLKFLIETDEKIVAVVTHEDDPNEEKWFRSVADLARGNRLPVYTPASPNIESFINLMRNHSPDLIFSFYYRRLLSKELLSISPMGGINLHGSLLPKYRGRCPVNWVLINGESETGVTLHDMVEKADAGDILAQKRVTIDLDDTAFSLARKITSAGVQLLKETWPMIKSGSVRKIHQDSVLARTFGGRRPEDGEVHWNQSAMAIYNLIRAVTHPYPGAFTHYDGRKIYLWSARLDPSGGDLNGVDPGTIEAVVEQGGLLVITGLGRLILRKAQVEGGTEISASELLSGQGVTLGSRFGKRSL